MLPPSATDVYPNVAAITALFGGPDVLCHKVDSPFDAHEMLLRGLPGRALSHLIDHLVILQKTASLEKAVGMSLRTYQRRRDDPERALTPEQSGRTWKFAEILSNAVSVFGSLEAAEHWMERPAMGLNQQRPIDLLATPAGVGMVETFLERLRYGVYT